jgi:hydrogenase 3 maturation protease
MMIFENSYNPIWQIILPAEANIQNDRLAIIGVGNELNGDDAAGIAFVHLLKENLVGSASVLVLEGATAPQNFTATLRRYKPDRVVIVDAAQMDLESGEAALIDTAAIDGMSCSTHTFPLSLLAKYLEIDLDCQVFFIGIQPEINQPFTAISPSVRSAVEELAASLTNYLRSEETSL